MINQPVKSNTKWLITFEQDYQKLLETKANQARDALPTSVDAKIILTATLYLLFEQFKLDDSHQHKSIYDSYNAELLQQQLVL